MIVELVDKLVDRAIQLLTYRKQMRTVLRDTYVAPVFAEFEQAHSAYLESFARYRDLIQGTKDPNWIRYCPRIYNLRMRSDSGSITT